MCSLPTDISSGTLLLLDPVPNQPSSLPSSSSFSESGSDPELSAEGREPSSHDGSSDTESQPPSTEENPLSTSGGEEREALKSPAGETTSDTMQGQSDMPSTEKDPRLPEEPHPSLPSRENASTEVHGAVSPTGLRKEARVTSSSAKSQVMGSLGLDGWEEESCHWEP